MNLRALVAISAVSLTAVSCNLFSQSSPAGVYKTLNGGADWQASNKLTGQTNATSISTLSVSAISFQPGSTEVMYVSGLNGGLFRSTDSGGTWARILSRVLTYDVAVPADNVRTIYAAGSIDGTGRVLKTIDGGTTWQAVYTDAVAGSLVRSVVVNPSNSNQIAIGTAAGSVLTSNDGGLSWKLWHEFSDQLNRIRFGKAGLYVVMKAKGVYLSSSWGGEFVSLTDNAFGSKYVTDFLNPNAPQKLEAGEYRQLYIDEAGSPLLYLTTQKGLFKSSDGGTTWKKLQLPIGPEDAVGPRAVTVAKSSSNLVFVSIGPTLLKSTDGGSSWQTQPLATGGTVNYILVDPSAPQIVYAGVVGDQ